MPHTIEPRQTAHSPWEHGAAHSRAAGRSPRADGRTAYLQRIGTAVPRHDVHESLVARVRSRLRTTRERDLLEQLIRRCGIAHRYAVLPPGRAESGEIDAAGFYRESAFPTTAARMALHDRQALPLALHAVQALGPTDELPSLLARVTHLIVASSSGFAAPGLDVQLVDALALPPEVQRTAIGFMGDTASLAALRLAREAVCADPEAQVLVVHAELCSLHLRDSHQLQDLLPCLLEGDGAAAALVGSEPVGAELLDFQTTLLPDTRELMRGQIGDSGVEMHVLPQAAERIAQSLLDARETGAPAALCCAEALSAQTHWAVQARDAATLDAVQRSLGLPAQSLLVSREVLHDVGHVSSATMLFALRRILSVARPGEAGVALAFGPGITAETLHFRLACLS